VDNEQTAVIFRKWPNGQIIALFPAIPADLAGNFCSSYMLVGQHGAASYCQVIQATAPASPEEYRNLFGELSAIGYRLKVYKRHNGILRKQYAKNFAEMRKSPPP
jgi:hypothetical protein